MTFELERLEMVCFETLGRCPGTSGFLLTAPRLNRLIIPRPSCADPSPYATGRLLQLQLFKKGLLQDLPFFLLQFRCAFAVFIILLLHPISVLDCFGTPRLVHAQR